MLWGMLSPGLLAAQQKPKPTKSKKPAIEIKAKYKKYPCKRDRCVADGHMYLHDMLGGAPTRDDLMRALEFFQAGCEQGVMEGCIEAGDVILSDSHFAPFYEDARRFHSKACDAGEVKGCIGLARVYAEGEPRDAKKADGLFDKVCKGGDGEGCWRHADFIIQPHRTTFSERARGGKKEAAKPLPSEAKKARDKALALYKKSCSLKNHIGCEVVAIFYYGPEYQMVDLEKSRDYSGRACESGSGSSCQYLAGVLAREKNTKKAKRYWEIGCNEHKHMGCCQVAGQFFLEKYKDKGSTSALSNARDFFHTGCKEVRNAHGRKDVWTCNKLAEVEKLQASGQKK